MNDANGDAITPLTGIEQMLYDRIGLDPTTVGSSLVERAVQRRMTLCRIRDRNAYSVRLEHDLEEMLELVEEVVIPETYFFREPEALDAVAVLMTKQEWLATRAQPLRVLSAPCSTGEEPYSIAMTLLAAGVPPEAFLIDAVDVSREAVARARTASYRGAAFRATAQGWYRFFDELPGARVVDAHVRKQVRFEQANLLDADFRAPAASYDVIFCRNLLIYFDAATQARVLTMLTSLLAPDGVLVVGAADTFAVRRAGFVPVAGAERAFLFCYQGATAALLPHEPGVKAGSTPRRAPLARIVQRKPIVRRASVRTAKEDVSVRAPSTGSAPLLADISRLASAGRLAEAIRIGESALSTFDSDAELLALMGTTYAASGDSARAETCYRRALYLEPSHAEVLLHLALLLDARGEGRAGDRLRARARRQIADEAGGAR